MRPCVVDAKLNPWDVLLCVGQLWYDHGVSEAQVLEALSMVVGRYQRSYAFFSLGRFKGLKEKGGLPWGWGWGLGSV